MNKDLLERREGLLRLIVRGVSPKFAAEELAKAVPDPWMRVRVVAAIRRDWGNRDRWMVNVVRLNDESFLDELVAGMREAFRCCWVTYALAESSSAKIAALRTVILGAYRIGMLLLKAGVIQAAPVRMDGSVTIAGSPFDCDPELRRVLLDEAERQREENQKGLPRALAGPLVSS